MRPNDNRDLSDLSLDDLMADLEAVDQPARGSVETWLDLDGWYPGSTLMSAADLHRKYVEWVLAQPTPPRPLGVRAWGKVMTSRFRKTRGSGGYSYYVSRESLSDIVRKLK